MHFCHAVHSAFQGQLASITAVLITLWVEVARSHLCAVGVVKMNYAIENPTNCEVRSVSQLLNIQKMKLAEIYWKLKAKYNDNIMSEKNARKGCEIFNKELTIVHDEI